MEVKRFPGKIISKNRYMLDQLSEEDDKWYWAGKGSFNMHLKKTYNLTEKQYYNLIVFGDINYIPKCKKCGKPVEFMKLSKGYHDYCSTWCNSASDETKKSRFLAYNYTEAYLYIAKLENDSTKIKVGITGMNNYRTRWHYGGRKLTKPEILISGTPEFITNLELDVDHKFCVEGELMEADKLNDLLDYINIVKSSTTIPQGSTAK